ncbi:flagellar hook assembly protein FlgD [Pseudooceanicola sp.]|uniref:flagellar hook assembly protein FlgD n=1 Tax=Pseudooceanicola sp. TaxID=1914328 RepID=UPI0040589B1B
MLIDSYGTAAAGGTSAQNSLSKLGADYQSFLKLLTAQISNQDPLEPMDSTTFVTQLAQLSQVEQSVAVNTNLETISGQMANLGSLAGLALIGRTVVAPSDMATLGAEGAPVSYRLAQDANSVTMTVYDDAGEIVRVLKELPASSEQMQTAVWDGRDMDGTLLPEGTYRVEIEALDAADSVIASQTYGRSRVERMSFEQGMATLHLANGTSVMAGLVEMIE